MKGKTLANAAIALCMALTLGCMAGCAEEAPTRDPNMAVADAELLDYINAYYDDYQDAVSLDDIPSDVIISAQEQMQSQQSKSDAAQDAGEEDSEASEAEGQ